MCSFQGAGEPRAAAARERGPETGSGRGGTCGEAIRCLGRGFSGMREFFRNGLRPGSPSALAFAVMCAVVATAIRVLVGLAWPNAISFATYFPAILIATLIGGWLAGALA